MTFSLESVVPWGSSFAEYQCMFSLSRKDLDKSILGCADGPASFNAEATHKGVQVMSCDPLYRFSSGEIRRRIGHTRSEIMVQTMANQDEFLWKEFASPAELEQARPEAMDLFLDDYDIGLGGQACRRGIARAVVPGSTIRTRPLCPFPFSIFGPPGLDFHMQAIAERVRVTTEVRIFPVNNLGGAVSIHLEPVVAMLHAAGMAVAVEAVPYEFVRGSNRMLQVVGPTQGEISSIRELM